MKSRFYFNNNAGVGFWLPFSIFIFLLIWGLGSCQKNTPVQSLGHIELSADSAAAIANRIRNEVSAQVIEGLELGLWASDSLAPDPIAITIDEQGRLYMTKTNRQKNSEFDIRGHRDWMTASISMQSVEDRRRFLRETFAPERSEENEWFPDLNQDSIHDWRDLTVEKEQVYRIEDRDGDGIADYSQLFLEDFHSEVTDVAMALLVHGEDVFLGVAPDMWRIQDRNKDGVADFKESISHGYQVHIGFGAHGMSGLTIGPDGRVYWGIGDIGMNVVDQTGKQWKYPNQGVIVRSEPDGSNFEVFAAGLRNTHEFVFDPFGNLISVDNDGDHPGEKERIVYIVNGSDSGWRINWQFGKYTDPDNNTYKVWMEEELFKPRFEGQAAYITPPILNYHSGPTGLKYNPGTALSPEWKDHFIMSEFTGSPARSRVFGFQLKPKGAGFEFAGEKELLRGVLVTGIDFGPDGALYMGDWIEGWGTKDFGRIWKLDAPKAVGSAIRLETKGLIEADFGKKEIDDLVGLLDHEDMRVRRKAQFELAKRGDKGAQALIKATQSGSQLQRIHGLWGLWQLARKEQAYAIEIERQLQDTDPEIRAQACKILGDIRYIEAAAALPPLLGDPSPRVQFFAAEALGRLAYQPATREIIAMLEANDDRDLYLRQAGAIALARIGDPKPLVALAEHPSRALRIAAVVALRRLRDPGVAAFLKDEDEWVVTEAARAINDDFSIEEALPELARILQEKRFREEALIRRAINANLRVGLPENLDILADYALRSDVEEEMRAEALASLGVWPKPSVLDRVTGRLRGPIERDPALARAVVARIITPLLRSDAPMVKIAASETAGRLEIYTAGPALFALARKDDSPKVRAAALNALLAIKAVDLEEAIQIALRDPEKMVRTTALGLIPEMKLAPDRAVPLFASILGQGSLEEQQTALEALGKLPAKDTEAILGKLLDQLLNGQLDPAIQLDLIEAIEKGGSEDLQDGLRMYQESGVEDDLLALYRSCLEGGDVDAGRELFIRHEAAQCIRCHAVGDWGGDVGPMLMGIASRLSREELLLSLVDPSAARGPRLWLRHPDP